MHHRTTPLSQMLSIAAIIAAAVTSITAVSLGHDRLATASLICAFIMTVGLILYTKLTAITQGQARIELSQATTQRLSYQNQEELKRTVQLLHRLYEVLASIDWAYQQLPARAVVPEPGSEPGPNPLRRIK
jgi:hypothetical protein